MDATVLGERVMPKIIRWKPGYFWVETMQLDPHELGIFTRLACFLWNKDGHWSNEDERMARVCMVSQRKYRKVKDKCLELGLLVEQNGSLVVPFIQEWQNEKRAAIPDSVRRAVWDKNGGRCGYCDCELTWEPSHDNSFHVDHVLPWSRGGSDNVENLTAACRECNLSKGARK